MPDLWQHGGECISRNGCSLFIYLLREPLFAGLSMRITMSLPHVLMHHGTNFRIRTSVSQLTRLALSLQEYPLTATVATSTDLKASLCPDLLLLGRYQQVLHQMRVNNVEDPWIHGNNPVINPKNMRLRIGCPLVNNNLLSTRDSCILKPKRTCHTGFFLPSK